MHLVSYRLLPKKPSFLKKLGFFHFCVMLFSVLTLLLLSSCVTSEPPPPTPPPATEIVRVVPATATFVPLPLATPLPTSTATPSLTATPIPPTPTSTATPLPTATPAGACACGLDCRCQIEQVVIISVDGLRPDALAQADTPAWDALQAQGAYQPVAQAVLPSVTLINHASMLTGMSPAKHGITWNDNLPDLGYVNGPSLFSVAHEAGLTTAMVTGKPKLEHIAIPGSVDTYIYAGFTDKQVTTQALGVIEAGLPNILFIHLPDVDSTGHLMGWMTNSQLWTIEATDQLIGQLVMALETSGYMETTLLILTADHGGVDRAHGGDSPAEVNIPWLAVGPGVPANTILTSDIMMYDTAATVLYAFDLPIPANWDGQPVKEIFAPATGS